ncbi:MAG TPA: VOC family protein [Dehalococcoidia bacterium]|nr:VOC family protein [Dehalococcoidia bacterium]
MPAVASLGHVGLHVTDIERSKHFYHDILGLRVTDEDPERGMVFLSARPDDEHHELLLMAGRNVGREAKVVQQVSFKCDSLEDLISFHRRLNEEGVQIDRVVSHGIALGIYCFDPDGNVCEVYWSTGLKARQPWIERVDLSRPPDELMRDVEASVRRYGSEGYINI